MENFQDKLRVQKVNFANECAELLQHVSDVDINDDRRHRSWQDPGLEEKVKARLEENYGACVSALRLINDLLIDILRETGTLDILTEQVSRHDSWKMTSSVGRLAIRSDFTINPPLAAARIEHQSNCV